MINNLKEVALAYYKMGFNLSPIKGMTTNAPSFKAPLYNDWGKYLNERQKENVIWNVDWESMTGVGAILGNNCIRALDIDGVNLQDFHHHHYLEESLELLGLPEDYEWVVYSGSDFGIHIYFKAEIIDDRALQNEVFIYNSANGEFNQIELRYRAFLVLPPSTNANGGKYRFRFGEIPKYPPLSVSIDRINSLLDRFCSETETLVIEPGNGKQLYLYDSKKRIPTQSYSQSTEEYVHYVQDDVIWLSSCSSKKAMLSLGCLLLEQHLYDNAHEAFRKAHSYFSHYNLAVLISHGVLSSSKEEFYSHLNVVKHYEQVYEMYYPFEPLSAAQIEKEYKSRVLL